jgi:hypothetical protein
LWSFSTEIVTAPVILSAEWLDTDSSGDLNDFDEIMVNFSEPVTGTVDYSDFVLLVASDAWGSGASATFMGNESVTIKLGAGVALTIDGVFNLAATTAGSPSGIAVSTTQIVGQTSSLPVAYGYTDIGGTISGSPPPQAVNPVPADLAINVPANQQLSWSPIAEADWYIVYFGTSSPGTYQGCQSATTFNPGVLSTGTTYFWRINPYNAFGTTTGNVWKFTTAAGPPGSLVWAKSAGGGSDDEGSAVSTLPDGTAFVTGYFRSTATFGNASQGGNETILTSAGEQDVFIAKYNPDGTLAWAKSAGGGFDDRGYGISAVPDGSAIVTGLFSGTATFGNASEGTEIVLSSAGGRDVFIAKYNPDGTLDWAKSAGDGSEDSGFGISAFSDGSAVVTGYYQWSAKFGAGEPNEITLTSPGGYDFFIAKYNPDGTLAWAKTTGPANGGRGSGVSALDDGSSIVTGHFWATTTFGPNEANETDLVSYGGFDVFIAKFNP